MGQSPPGDTYNESGIGLPFFQGKAEFGVKYPRVRKWCSVPVKEARAGDILLSVRAPVGPTNLAAENCCIGRGLASIRARERLAEQGYVYYFLRHVEHILERRGLGSTFQAIGRNDIASLAFPLPPPSEQRRIAELLDQADALRRVRVDADAKAERILPALFIKMFGNPATNPKGFDVLTLGDPRVGELDRGRSRHRPRNDPSLLGGTHPLIQTGDVARCDGRIRSHSQTYTDLGLSQSKMWPKGTLCITIAANIAKTGVLEFDACFPDSVVGFVPGTRATTEHVQFFLQFLQPVLERDAPQAAQKNINLEILRGLPCPIPPRELQDEFSARVREHYSVRRRQIDTNSQMESLFANMGSRAFGGTLTASWRDANLPELLQEIEQQSRYLAAPPAPEPSL